VAGRDVVLEPPLRLGVEHAGTAVHAGTACVVSAVCGRQRIDSQSTPTSTVTAVIIQPLACMPCWPHRHRPTLTR
jgi:hypothetical protein